MIACWIPADDAALDVAEHVVEDRDSIRSSRESKSVKTISERIGKSAGQRFLAFGKDIDGETRSARYGRINRRVVLDADENERWHQAHGAKGAHGHSTVFTAGIDSRDHCYAGCKSAEYCAKCVLV